MSQEQRKGIASSIVAWLEKNKRAIIDTLSVAFIPLLPIMLDLAFWGKVYPLTLSLTSCLYPLTIGAWAKKEIFTTITAIICIFGSVAYGVHSLDLQNDRLSENIIFQEGEILYVNSALIIIPILCIIISIFIFFLENSTRSAEQDENLNG